MKLKYAFLFHENIQYIRRFDWLVVIPLVLTPSHCLGVAVLGSTSTANRTDPVVSSTHRQPLSVWHCSLANKPWGVH